MDAGADAPKRDRAQPATATSKRTTRPSESRRSMYRPPACARSNRSTCHAACSANWCLWKPSLAVDEDWNLAMRKHLLGFTAHQQPGHAAAAVGGHKNQVALIRFRGLDDRLIRPIATCSFGGAANLCCIGQLLHLAEIPVRLSFDPFVKFGERHETRGYVIARNVGAIYRRHVEDRDTCAIRAREADGRLRSRAATGVTRRSEAECV